MRSIPETRYAKTADGVHVAYQVVGEGPMDIVYTGGFVISFEACWDEPYYRRFLERLSSFGRVILFDRRGTGVSDPTAPGDSPTLEQWADDALAVMDDAGSEQAALMGFGGLGGPVAILFAASHPERTTSLVLVNTTATGISPVLAQELGDAEFGERFVQDWGRSDRDLTNLAPSVASDASFKDWLARAYRLSASPSVALALARIMRTVDVRDVLASVKVPTLVIHRTGSHNIDAGRALAEAIPGARLVELDGADHLIWVGETGPMFGEIEEFLTGTRSGPDLDRVFATLLFTDIVSSTERTVKLGDKGWRAVLDRHDNIVTREIDRFKGRLVESTGDGLFASFDGPARAVRCTQAISQRLAAAGTVIRAGLHAGEVETRGDRVSGIAVNIAARVSALAQDDEILVSRTVTDLVAGSGLEFEDRGEHDLKGVPGRWQLYAVRA